MDDRQADSGRGRDAVRGGPGRCQRCAVRVVGGAVALSLWAGAGVQSAYAGTYVMRNCEVPGHGNAPLGPWQPNITAPRMTFLDACTTGGGFGFTFPEAIQMPKASSGLLALVRPTAGPRNAIRLVKARVWYSARLVGSGSPVSVHSIYVSSDRTPFSEVPHGPPGGEDLVFERNFSPLSTDQYYFGIICSADTSSSQDCNLLHKTPLAISGMEVTLTEDIEPKVLRVDGTLVADDVLSGFRTLTYSASDREAGLAKAEVLLGDTVVASRDLTARCAYDDFTVCPEFDESSLNVDTRTVPDGLHRLMLRVRDAAGNVRLEPVAKAVEVRNESGTAPASLRLTARLAGSSRSTATVPFGRRVTVRGRLSRASTGVGRVRVKVLERPQRPRAREVLLGTALTKLDGSFSYRLAAHRPSRTVRLSYASGGQVASRTVRLRVRTAARLQASLRGVVVRFNGRVVGLPLPLAGKHVLLQGRAPGFSWATFDKARTDRRGVYSGRYRLPIRRPGVKLQIRVVVPRERSYPYESYTGRPITLRVR